MSLRIVLRAALVLLVLGVLALMFTRSAERARFVGAYSSYGGGPRSALGVYTLSERLGLHPQRVLQDLSRLPSDAVLIAFGGCDATAARPSSRYERDELTRFVADGGVLLVAGARNYLPAELGVQLEGDPCVADASDDEDSVGAAPRWALPMAAPLLGLPIVPLRGSGHLMIDDKHAHVVLFGSADDAAAKTHDQVEALGVSVQHGRGTVIALASGSPFQNRDLLDAGGGVLLARLLAAYAPQRRVIFDEYHLGVGDRRSAMQYFRQMGGAPLGLQLLLAIVCLLWRAAARLGAVHTPSAPTSIETHALQLTARNYQRAHDEPAVLELIVRRALSRIAKQHRLRADAPRSLETALRAKGAVEAAAAVQELEQLLRMPASTTSTLALTVQRMDAAAARALGEHA